MSNLITIVYLFKPLKALCLRHALVPHARTILHATAHIDGMTMLSWAVKYRRYSPLLTCRALHVVVAADSYCGATIRGGGYFNFYRGVAEGRQGRWSEKDNYVCRRDENGELYYTQEFTVQTPNFFRHDLSVYAAR